MRHLIIGALRCLLVDLSKSASAITVRQDGVFRVRFPIAPARENKMKIGNMSAVLGSRRLSGSHKISLAVLAGISVGAMLVESSVDAYAYVVHRGATVRGPHGGVYHRGGTVVGHPGYHGGYGRYGGWARPGGYWWHPGGAIAAGAAIGFVSAATAAAWAGAAPGPGLCWYYTSPAQTQGFWDACQ
jgi:hypothetical protein